MLSKKDIESSFYLDRYELIMNFLKDEGIVVERIKTSLKLQLRLKYESEEKSSMILEALQRLACFLDRSLNKSEGLLRINVQYIGKDNEIKITMVVARKPILL